ncbi:MAG: prolyl oligopeptidase family serine peptidase [Bacteroidetes bacterium]|nr:prolyl oligopeptidase family serine peptidase [Bacteroidota bacterium]
MGAVGASYGGFSVFCYAGHHEKRFKAFISHCGVFNFEAMGKRRIIFQNKNSRDLTGKVLSQKLQ